MSEDERRAEAARYHAEYRDKALTAPATTARWILAAAAAGAVTCLNGLIDAGMANHIAEVLAQGVTGFVMSMSMTGAGLSFINRADTEDMILWSKLDRPPADIPPKDETDIHINKALRARVWAARLLVAGNISFMFTAIYGAWALNAVLAS